MRESIAGRLVGSRVPRVEDARLLSGRGRYIDDVVVPGMLHAAFLRSTVAHGRIAKLDVGAARRAPGVTAVFTGEDITAITNPFVNLAMLPGLYSPSFWALAVERVRFVGDPVALVIASSRALAEDAIALIDVEYEQLPPVASIGQAMAGGEPLWPKAGGNVVYDHTDTAGDVDAVFASAAHVLTERFTSHRQSNQPMETRGCVAEIRDGQLTFHAATQSAHALRWILTMCTSRRSMGDTVKALAGNRERLKAFGRGAKEFLTANKEEMAKQDNAGMRDQLRRDPATIARIGRTFVSALAQDRQRMPDVVAGDIGGAFGVKGHPSREDVAVCAAALQLGRSVKWIEDRVEHLTVGGMAREEQLTMSLAVSATGEVLGMRCDLVVDQGAYPAIPFGAPLFTRIMRVMMPGAYRIGAFELRSRIVSTNKAHYVAYRGPWANETWARERMLDVVARRLGLSAAEIRLRNMWAREELPQKMVTGPTLDAEMTARDTLVRALELADEPSFRRRQADARAEGRLLGLGIATFHEAAPGPPDFGEALMPGGGMLMTEPIRTVLEDDGTVSVFTQQVPHGQSHETTFAQVAADELGVPIEQVRLVYGDTRRTPFALLGTGGSRGGPMAGGGTLFAARDLRSKILDVAADLLEANRDDLMITGGAIHVAGVPSISVSFADVARRAGTDRLTAEVAYDGGQGGWVQATHVCEVEIDAETGVVRIPHYVVVEDCGAMINPAIVDGQIRGGVAQGIGAVLYEKAHYDEHANFQAATFLDYLIPTSMEIPDIEVHHLDTPSDREARFRGVGEGGMIGAPAAITNAVEDALAHLGVTITEQHLPPTRILELMRVIR